jgi:hypothetical protein
MVANLQTRIYQSQTIGGAIATWAPGSDGNDPARYAAQVSNWIELNVATPMRQLNADQLNSVAGAIRRYEGWRAGTVSATGSK